MSERLPWSREEVSTIEEQSDRPRRGLAENHTHKNGIKIVFLILRVKMGTHDGFEWSDGVRVSQRKYLVTGTGRGTDSNRNVSSVTTIKEF